MLYKDLLSRIQSYVQHLDGEWDVMVFAPGNVPENGLTGREYEMASLGKLAILLYVLECMPTKLAKRVVLEREHQRPGTGILKHCSPGLELTLFDALRLMVIESDNTAANMVLAQIDGGQAEVIRHLRIMYDVEQVGLVEREHGFESGVATAREILFIWSVIWDLIDPRRSDGWHDIDRAFAQSHARDGLKSCHAPDSMFYGDSLMRLVQLTGLTRLRSLQSRLIASILRRPASMVRGKEGSLDWQGEGFRHEVAVFYPGPDQGIEPLLVGVFSRGWPAELGYSINHPARQAINQIGWMVSVSRAMTHVY